MFIRLLVPILSLAVCLMGLTGTSGYIFQVPSLYRWIRWDVGMAFPTTMGFFLLGLAMLLHTMPPRKFK